MPLFALFVSARADARDSERLEQKYSGVVILGDITQGWLQISHNLAKAKAERIKCE